MDFTRVNRRSVKLKYEGLERYPHEMQLYEDFPAFTISISELEQAMAERLMVLQTLEEVGNRALKIGTDDWRKTVVEELKKLNLRGFCKLITATSLGTEEDDFRMRRKDHISHFMLRVSYAETEDKRRWFINREIELFRLRWMYLLETQKTAFFRINKVNYDLAEDDEKRQVVKLAEGFLNISQNYYKIPVWKVGDLIRNRKVFFHKGTAYITIDEIISVILTSFRQSLAQNLAYISRRMNVLDADPRIQGLVRGAGNRTKEVDYTNLANKDKIDIRQLDTLSEISFPLCMKQIHQRLKTVHHLKNFARQQYGLFLKGIGVTLEDALVFWRTEFCKTMEPDKFEKSYAYNVRHNYGKEGKRANYAPHSCGKIISATVLPGQFHGCPFKTLDATQLGKILHKDGLSVVAQKEIADLAKKGHYQLACSSYFNYGHKTTDVVVQHPNYYFDESRRILLGKIVKKEEKTTVRQSTETTNKLKQEQPSTTNAVKEVDEWEEMNVDFSQVP